MTTVKEGNLSVEELLLHIRSTILYKIKYGENNYWPEIEGALQLIQSAAYERGDRKVGNLAYDMIRFLEDNTEARGIVEPYMPSEEKIKEAFIEKS